jgi:hypothetical protein
METQSASDARKYWLWLRLCRSVYDFVESRPDESHRPQLESEDLGVWPNPVGEKSQKTFGEESLSR